MEGTAYLPILTAEFDVELTDPLSPFLRPNQQVDYTTAPLTLARAAELTADAADDGEKTKRIYEFVSTTLRYDDDQAESVQSGYIPALDEVLQREKGICLDFAARASPAGWWWGTRGGLTTPGRRSGMGRRGCGTTPPSPPQGRTPAEWNMSQNFITEL